MAGLVVEAVRQAVAAGSAVPADCTRGAAAVAGRTHHGAAAGRTHLHRNLRRKAGRTHRAGVGRNHHLRRTLPAVDRSLRHLRRREVRIETVVGHGCCIAAACFAAAMAAPRLPLASHRHQAFATVVAEQTRTVGEMQAVARQQQLPLEDPPAEDQHFQAEGRPAEGPLEGVRRLPPSQTSTQRTLRRTFRQKVCLVQPAPR